MLLVGPTHVLGESLLMEGKGEKCFRKTQICSLSGVAVASSPTSIFPLFQLQHPAKMERRTSRWKPSLKNGLSADTPRATQPTPMGFLNSRVVDILIKPW